MHSQNRNSNLGACSQVAVFDYIPCVRSYRTHSTAVNEINVERSLRHIYELGAWLVAVEASTRTNSRSGRGSSGSSVLWKVCKKGKLITQNSNTAWKMPFEIQAVFIMSYKRKSLKTYRLDRARCISSGKSPNVNVKKSIDTQKNTVRKSNKVTWAVFL